MQVLNSRLREHGFDRLGTGQINKLAQRRLASWPQHLCVSRAVCPIRGSTSSPRNWHSTEASSHGLLQQHLPPPDRAFLIAAVGLRLPRDHPPGGEVPGRLRRPHQPTPTSLGGFYAVQ